jgi:hypothetical protein
LRLSNILEEQSLAKKLRRAITSEKRIYPSFIIFGSTRTGTTSLYEYLENHPSILPPIKKEIGFFNYAYHTNPKWYKMYFPTTNEKQKVENIKKNKIITGESTPSYFIDPRVPKRIFSLLPKIKLVALLRNPVDRAISHYQLNVSIGVEKLSFEDAVKNESKRILPSLKILEKDKPKGENSLSYFFRMLSFQPENYFKFSYLNSGCYYDHLKNWYDIFPQDQILVIKSEDFFENPNKIFQKIQRFLDLPIVEFQKYWRAYEIKHPHVSNNIRNYLKNYYESHNSKLYKFLDKDFNWT